ncbi:hypothetical protein ACFR9U_05850 [Halorientalis brevis]|uniref:Uncharacterized protein n=1 Tax=Halorientalis brevis TaxID=1126241 RepID=A0ABD6C867_9EURY|nr:hypothetical protein [Halorientalis brevis]
MLPEVLPLVSITPSDVAWGSRALTALVGLFVAGLAYRGYRRNDAPKMRSLALGIFLLTTGVFLTVAVVTQVGAGAGPVLLARGLVTVTGLGAVLYALVYQ